MLWGWLMDSFPQYHLHMIALGLVSTSLPTLGPLLGVPLSWMAINPQDRSFCNKQSHHMLWGWLLDSFPQYHLHMIALGLVSTSLPTLGPLLGVPLSWMAINPQDRSFCNKQSHHMLWGWLLDSFPQYHLHMIALGLVSTSLPTLGPLLGVPLSWMAINPQDRSFCNKQSHHMLWGWLLDSFPQYHLHMIALGLVSTSLPTLGPLLGVPLSWMAINPQDRSFCNKQSHHMLWGWLLDSFPQYHLHMIALGLVSTSLPTLGPLLGVPLSWMAINPQDRSFCNKQSHHMLWGWLLDSFPQYHLHMIALGLVSTSLPTLGPLLGVPLSWMAINPQERSFCNKQSHHMLWGWLLDSFPQYHLHMIALGLVSTSLPTLGPLLGVPLSWMAINPQERSICNSIT